jgi:hypothetical protein
MIVGDGTGDGNGPQIRSTTAGKALDETEASAGQG